MLGENGFTYTEYMSQVLKWKAEGTTFSIRRLENPLSLHQSTKLRKLAKFFTTIDEESGKYKDLFTLQEDQLRKLEMSETQSNKKGAKNQKGKGGKGDALGGKGKGKG